MRTISRIGVAAGLAVLAAAGAVDAAGAATSAPAPTVKVVVRPVTSAGHASAGYTVKAEPSGSVDCSVPAPSPAAVSPNIEVCSPSFEYAVACWKAAAPHRALCLRDPRRKELARIPRTGAFANTGLAPARQRAPLAIRLGDGDFCSVRNGGAVGPLPGHPNLSATYFCVHDGAVWATANAAHLGVNESNPVWTVRTARFNAHRLTTRRVAKAWFVGTAAG